jgi:hypothetical protein
MPFSPEMDSFQGKIGGYQEFVASRNAENGTVVADPYTDGWISTGVAPDARNQGFFSDGHGDHTIAERATRLNNVWWVRGLLEAGQRLRCRRYICPAPAFVTGTEGWVALTGGNPLCYLSAVLFKHLWPKQVLQQAKFAGNKALVLTRFRRSRERTSHRRMVEAALEFGMLDWAPETTGRPSMVQK